MSYLEGPGQIRAIPIDYDATDEPEDDSQWRWGDDHGPVVRSGREAMDSGEFPIIVHDWEEDAKWLRFAAATDERDGVRLALAFMTGCVFEAVCAGLGYFGWWLAQ